VIPKDQLTIPLGILEVIKASPDREAKVLRLLGEVVQEPYPWGKGAFWCEFIEPKKVWPVETVYTKMNAKGENSKHTETIWSRIYRCVLRLEFTTHDEIHAFLEALRESP